MFKKVNGAETIEKMLVQRSFDDIINTAKAGYVGSFAIGTVSRTGDAIGGNKNPFIVVYDTEGADLFLSAVPKGTEFFLLNSLLAFPSYVNNWYAYSNMVKTIESVVLSVTESSTDISAFRSLLRELALLYISCCEIHTDTEGAVKESAAKYLDWESDKTDREVLETVGNSWDILYQKFGQTFIPWIGTQSSHIPVLIIPKKGEIIQVISTLNNASIIANTVIRLKYLTSAANIYAKPIMDLFVNSESIEDIVNSLAISVTLMGTENNSSMTYRFENDHGDMPAYNDSVVSGLVFLPFIENGALKKDDKFIFGCSRFTMFNNYTRRVSGFYNEENETKFTLEKPNEDEGTIKSLKTLDRIVVVTMPDTGVLAKRGIDDELYLLSYVLVCGVRTMTGVNGNRFKEVKMGTPIIDAYLNAAEDLIGLVDMGAKEVLTNPLIDKNMYLFNPANMASKARAGLKLVNDKNKDDLYAAIRYWETVIEHEANFLSPVLVRTVTECVGIGFPLKPIYGNRVLMHVVYYDKSGYIGDPNNFNDMTSERLRVIKKIF